MQKISGTAVCNECEENRNKISKMQEDLSSKENKWTAALSKLQEQVWRPIPFTY
jgi:hypothetical protein